MKVTVCFGDLKVVVPCGEGDFLVSELIEKAVTRYKKASGKPSDYWVKVNALKNQRDGGILDLDDALVDVVDDKDQILAEYDEQRAISSPEQGEGDGTSGSSVGSTSPDLMRYQKSKELKATLVPSNKSVSAVLQHVARLNNGNLGIAASAPASHPTARTSHGTVPPPPPPKPVIVSTSAIATGAADSSTAQRSLRDSNGCHVQLASRNSVVVTETDLNKATGLHVLKVRRDSEPNLLVLANGSTAVAGEAGTLPKSQAKQWLPRVFDKKLPPPVMAAEMHEISTDSAAEDDEDSHREDKDESSGLLQFARDSSRHSLTGQGVLKWAGAVSKQPNTFDEMNSRHEPLGQSRSPAAEGRHDTVPLQSACSTMDVTLESSENGPLGIHVVPNIVDGRDAGLIIQDIEPDGRIDRDGRFSLYDLIEEINGYNLMNLTFAEAQQIFRQALLTNRISLHIRKNGGAALAADYDSQPEPELLDSPQHSLLMADTSSMPAQVTVNHGGDVPSPQLPASPPQLPPVTAPQMPPDGKEKLPPHMPHLPVRSPNMQLTSPSSTLMKANTRKIGKRLSIELLKGPEGLGFSITTRDNPAGGVAPIYVKNILPKGAAIADGRLKSGDRLLEINGIDTTGKSQEEAVAMLRNTKRGSTVSFVVSRQEPADQPSTLPRQLPAEQDEQLVRQLPPAAVTQRATPLAFHSFDIPLNETGSAGLGVSVKGNIGTADDGFTRDLGIFVKAVIHGGAASKDGRLMVNDQLVEINGESLSVKTNSEAMEALRTAMRAGGPNAGHIQLRVARRSAGAASLATFPTKAVDVALPPSIPESMGKGSSNAENAYWSDSTAPLSNIAAPSQPQRLGGSQPVAGLQLRKPAPARASVAANPMSSMRNPVLDRLTGGGVRNDFSPPARESSDQDDDNDSHDDDSDDALALYGIAATTLPTPQAPRDTVIIEDDSQPAAQRREKLLYQRKPRSSGTDFTKARPYSAIGGVGLLAGMDEAKLRNDIGKSRSGAAVIMEDTRQDGGSSSGGTFDREGFGRRSFSEKRKLEKNKELVEKAKALRDDAKDKGFQPGCVPVIARSSPATTCHLSPSFSTSFLSALLASASPPPFSDSQHDVYENLNFVVKAIEAHPRPTPRKLPEHIAILAGEEHLTSAYGDQMVSPCNTLCCLQSDEAESDRGLYENLPVPREDTVVSFNGTTGMQASIRTSSQGDLPPCGVELKADAVMADVVGGQSPSQQGLPHRSSAEGGSRTGTPRCSTGESSKKERRIADLLSSSPYPNMVALASEQLYASVCETESGHTGHVPLSYKSVPLLAVYTDDSGRRPTASAGARPLPPLPHPLGKSMHTANSPVNEWILRHGADEPPQSAHAADLCLDSSLFSSRPSVKPVFKPSTNGHCNSSSDQDGRRVSRASSVESLLEAARHASDLQHGGQTHLHELQDLGPTLGMKKSSSLESLQAMVEATQDNGGGSLSSSNASEALLWKGQTRVIRGRGCNESFRAAVDRSYEAPSGAGASNARNMSIGSAPMVRKVQEESSESGSGVRVGNDSSARSSFSDRAGGAEPSLDAGKGRKKDKKHKASTSTNFFGNLLRFTKNRKSMEDRLSSKGQLSAAFEPQQQQKPRSEAPQSGAARGGNTGEAAAQAYQLSEQQRAQERYKKLQETQRLQLTAAVSVASSSSSSSSGLPPVAIKVDYGDYSDLATAAAAGRAVRESSAPPLSNKATDKAVRLRLEHQERQGRYPHDEREVFYEQKIREREVQEWEANNRSNFANGLNPSWKVAVNDKGTSDGQRAPSAEPWFAGQTKPVGRSQLYSSRDARSGEKYDPTLLELQSRVHPGDSAPPTDSNYASLTRVTRPRTPTAELQPQKQPLVPSQQASSRAPGGRGMIGAASGAVPLPQPRSHQRFASYDSAASGGSAANGGAYLDYDDPRRAYAYSVHQHRPSMQAIGLRHDAVTGSAQV